MQINIEIKARCHDREAMKSRLLELGADYAGLDQQQDIYFQCAHGRLKLRSGNIENSLIFYDRDNSNNPKKSLVSFHNPSPGHNLQEIMTRALDVLVSVNKKRMIFFLENSKFHLDEVEGLGEFVEIEVIDDTGLIAEEKLRSQCHKYLQLLGIQPEDLLSSSYSDMLINMKNGNNQ
ncbi:MAG: class IV adenylate cyclase [Candidatus Cloacimonetes bacterium]|nr:class IV adenylate cyclase [Candidatus Cloacimonadota bacterium]